MDIVFGKYIKTLQMCFERLGTDYYSEETDEKKIQLPKKCTSAQYQMLKNNKMSYNFSPYNYC